MEKTSRREFVKHSAAIAAAAQVLGASRVLAQAAPNAKLGVAVVGAGGMGGYAVDQALKERFVAVCDVDDNDIAKVLKKAAEKQPDVAPPKVYHDYRRMLDEMAGDIDVVLISTPDHNHAPAAIRAIQRGKAVFCQKPLAHNIYECYALAKAAREAKVPTQMGNQGHCGNGIRQACEYLWDGCVGAVTETHTVLGRNFGGNGGRLETKPVPATLHWDEWLGPVAFRDYHDDLHHFNWRKWRAFGTGTIGDMACHNLDCLYWALKVGEAKTFTIECLKTTPGSAEMWSRDNIVKYTVPARAGMPQLVSYVYDHNDLRPDVVKQAEAEHEIKFGESTLYLGEKGLFWTTGTAGQARMLPLEKHKEYKEPEKTIPRAHGGPIDDLYWAIRNGGTPCSNFVDSAAFLTAFALTGHLAQLAGVGKVVEWDVEKMQCTNLPELNEHVRRTYREGWAV